MFSEAKTGYSGSRDLHSRRAKNIYLSSAVLRQTEEEMVHEDEIASEQNVPITTTASQTVSRVLRYYY